MLHLVAPRALLLLLQVRNARCSVNGGHDEGWVCCPDHGRHTGCAASGRARKQQHACAHRRGATPLPLGAVGYVAILVKVFLHPFEFAIGDHKL